MQITKAELEWLEKLINKVKDLNLNNSYDDYLINQNEKLLEKLNYQSKEKNFRRLKARILRVLDNASEDIDEEFNSYNEE